MNSAANNKWRLEPCDSPRSPSVGPQLRRQALTFCGLYSLAAESSRDVATVNGSNHGSRPQYVTSAAKSAINGLFTRQRLRLPDQKIKRSRCSRRRGTRQGYIGGVLHSVVATSRASESGFHLLGGLRSLAVLLGSLNEHINRSQEIILIGSCQILNASKSAQKSLRDVLIRSRGLLGSSAVGDSE